MSDLENSSNFGSAERPGEEPAQPQQVQPGGGERLEKGDKGNAVPLVVNSQKRGPEMSPSHLATSTFFSLVMVLGLLLLARLMVPSLVESTRYAWHKGELRAEYEVSGEQLSSVSLDSLADVSRLVSQRVGPSVVHINVRRKANSSPPERTTALSMEDRFEGQGSGFLISNDGFILTNEHVLEVGRDVEVTLSDGRRLPAAVIGTDRHTDLAVIKIESKDLMAVEWGDSEQVSVGTPVWAVGSPFGLQQTVTFGIVSGKHRVDFRETRDARKLRGWNAYGDLMQSDVALNPGNSGGPLVNSLGQVVGVNAAILGETFQGVSFSIPSKVAQHVADSIVKEGSVPRGWLGVVLEDLTQDERFAPDGTQRSGVRISRFPSGLLSPAKKAGLRVGDLITTFEGRIVRDTPSLIRMIGESPAGSVVTLGIERESTIEPPVDKRTVPVDSQVDGDQAPSKGATVVRLFEVQVTLERRSSQL